MGVFLRILGYLALLAGFISLFKPLTFLRIRTRGIGVAVMLGGLILLMLAPKEPAQQTATRPPATATQPSKKVAGSAEQYKHQAQWVPILRLAGSSEKRSGPFQLTGAKARIRYTVQGSSVACYIYVLEEGTTLEKEGGMPEVSVMDAGSDETYLVKDKGSYYLDVKSANCRWNIV
ncbi:MAG TPA: hypothetical protein VGL77_06570, partial [Armatimonadota bacterium]